jgi:hypothetical protein
MSRFAANKIAIAAISSIAAVAERSAACTFSAGASLFCALLAASPSNLEALLSIMDAECCSPEQTRCSASEILCSLSDSVPSIWSLKIPTSGKRFAEEFIRACSKCLADDATPELPIKHSYEDEGACCQEERWRKLQMALDQYKCKTSEIVDELYAFDWQGAIFVGKNHREVGLETVLWLFEALFPLAAHVVDADNDSIATKSLLRQLGSCHDLLHRACRRIVSLKDARSPADPNEVNLLCEIMVFILLSPVLIPSNSATHNLMRQVHSALTKLLRTRKAQLERAGGVMFEKSVDCAFRFTTETYWAGMVYISEEQRWQNFRAFMGSFQNPFGKRSRGNLRKFVNKRANEDAFGNGEEMCQGCFKTEAAVGHKLMRCSRVRKADDTWPGCIVSRLPTAGLSDPVSVPFSSIISVNCLLTVQRSAKRFIGVSIIKDSV